MGRLVVSGGIIGYLISLIDISRFCFIIGGARLEYLTVAPILILLSFVFAAFRWQSTLLEFGISRKIHDLYKYYIVGSLYSMVLPGAVGGDVVRVAMCAQGTSLLTVATSSLLERVCGVAGLFVIGASVVLFLPSSIPQSVNFPLLRYLPVVTAALAVLGISCVFIIRIFGVKLNIATFQKKWLRRVVELVVLLSQIKSRLFLVFLAFSILFQATGILADFFLAKALHIPLSLSYFFLVSSAIFIGSLLPVSLGGLGVREGMLVYFLSATGVPPSDAITFSFLIYCNRIIASSLGVVVLSLLSGRASCVTNIQE
jgi:uncharacterized protein (TIRG00374 family)